MVEDIASFYIKLENQKVHYLMV